MLVSQSLQGCLVVGVASVSAGFVILKNRKVNFYQVLPERHTHLNFLFAVDFFWKS
jgi:hypothetical protein